MSAEATVVRNYIDWLISLPWFDKTDINTAISEADKILDEDHYGLEKPKERILEYLAVQALVQKIRGPILCFVGPPGVGKTSLAVEVARDASGSHLDGTWMVRLAPLGDAGLVENFTARLYVYPPHPGGDHGHGGAVQLFDQHPCHGPGLRHGLGGQHDQEGLDLLGFGEDCRGGGVAFG